MKERPILFSGPMVKAILDGRKTQTRRVVKKLDGIWRLVETNYSKEEPNKAFIQDMYGDYHQMPCPYGRPGDQLWVRETWVGDEIDAGFGMKKKYVAYRADGNSGQTKWCPSIHMPRWASRITLEIVGIRVERLNDITCEDIDSEGISKSLCIYYDDDGLKDFDEDEHRELFVELWNSINGKKYPWPSNPWVWVIEFKRIARTTSARPESEQKNEKTAPEQEKLEAASGFEPNAGEHEPKNRHNFN